MKKEQAETRENGFNDVYADSIRKIRSAVEQGLSFDEACSLTVVKDAGLRESIVNDSLKAIIAEMHFSRGLPLKNLAMRLRVSLSRLLNAKEGMPGESGEGASAKKRKGSQVA
jgi:pilus assembly protein TadC